MPALFTDLTTTLRPLLAELDRTPDLFQTYDVHLELAAAGGVVVYETKRVKGVTDSLYWGRAPGVEAVRQLTQGAAFAAIDRFLALGAHLALSNALPEGVVLDAAFPHCAVRFAYRKKGAPKAQALSMVFLGFNDEAEALAYANGDGAHLPLVTARPLAGRALHEWR